MSFIEQTGPETALEATRIFLEAHSKTLSPIWRATERQIRASLTSVEMFNHDNSLAVEMLFLPQGTRTSIPFSARADSGAAPVDRTRSNLDQLDALWECTAPACGYLLPEHGSDYDFKLALILRIGGWERNQPLSGLVAVFWQGRPSGEFPFPTPAAASELPPLKNTRFLPLPPRFERSRKKDAPWITLPAKIVKSAEWSRLETAVADLSEAGAEILQRLVPVLGDAAWKSMASRVMHELVRTVSMPQSTLEGARNALCSAYDAVSQSSLPFSDEVGQRLVGHLKTVNANLKEMENDQDYVLSKVHWFFNLVAQELRAEEPERASLLEILQQTVKALGCRPDSDLILERPEHVIWASRLRLPRLFPQHCLEAMISNSFIHRDSAIPVRFQLENQADGEYNLEWKNHCSPAKAERLLAELGKAPNARNFGLRMADSIAEAFFGVPMQISVGKDPAGPVVHHRLRLKAALLLIETSSQAKPAETTQIP